jgi:diguanylate cyclase (GGDEF)-like protein
MPGFYLTPASVSYLTQFILALAITIFLLRRLRSQPTSQLFFLTTFFALVAVFIGLLFLDAALSPFHRLLVVYAENSVLALALVFLVRFAYNFPEQFPQHKWEARLILAISLAYFFWEGGFMIYRYSSLFRQGTVDFRPYFASYCMAVVLLLPPLAFIRQCLAADSRSVHWLRKLWKPEGKGARGARNFVLVFGILFVLGLFNVALIFELPHTAYNAAMSVGVLTALWLFSTNYLNFIPGGVNVSAKLSILTLTLFLAMLGSMSWLIAPPYIAMFCPNLKDHQTLRFTPNPDGGYDVTEVEFAFEDDLGNLVQVGFRDEHRNYRIKFTFPFYGESYSEVYVANSGVISLGQPFWQPNMQADVASAPTIMPLFIDLDPDPALESSGLYIREEPERLVLTWNQLPALYQPEAIFTFQAVLYANGTFEFTYNGLPLPFTFDPDATPSANPWMRGAVSDQGEPLHVLPDVPLENARAADLLTIAKVGGSPLLENYQLAFRRYLHAFMLPVSWVAIGGSLLLLLMIPLLMRFSIVKPLEALATGVRRMEAGDLNVSIPVQNKDEIGFLTRAFNSMEAEIRSLVTSLEEQVAARTVELTDANRLLKEQLLEIQSLQDELREQVIRDPLTNAFNRRYLLETLERELARAVRAGHPFSLIMIDVDHFKKFNDDYGHQAGDVLLQRLVSLLVETSRKGDAVCRYGGEEFVILMPNTAQESAYRRAETWRIACEKIKENHDGKSIEITISLGVVTSFAPAVSAEELLMMADRAMYQAKASGRNCTAIFEQPGSGDLLEK